MCSPLLLRPSLLLFCLILLGMTAHPGQAQQPTEPFSTVELRLAGIRNINRNFLHEFWKPGGGVEVTLATPFYLGFLEFGTALHRYDAEQEVPGFGALWLYAGWGLGADVTDRIRLEGSGRIGNYHMSFDGGSEFTGVINESELALMVQIGMAPGLGRRLLDAAHPRGLVGAIVPAGLGRVVVLVLGRFEFEWDPYCHRRCDTSHEPLSGCRHTVMREGG